MTRKGTAATTRLRKAECDACGYIIRVSRKWLEVGLPTCPCGTVMTCPELTDAVIADPAVLDTLGDRARNQIMRELGYTDEIVRKHGSHRVIGQRRCSHASCSRFVAVDATTCAAGHAQQWAIRTGAIAVSTAGAAMPF